MDDTYRLKIKLGADEFEASGPVEIVQAQFKAFADLIAQRQTIAASQAQITPTPDESSVTMAAPRVDVSVDSESLSRIMKLDGRVVSLTARPGSAEEAVLLLLYGQKQLRNNDSVTGSEVIDGLTTTGGLQVARADRMLEKIARDGHAIVIGERRAKRYRLTNQGLARARQIASDLIAIVA